MRTAAGASRDLREGPVTGSWVSRQPVPAGQQRSGTRRTRGRPCLAGTRRAEHGQARRPAAGAAPRDRAANARAGAPAHRCVSRGPAAGAVGDGARDRAPSGRAARAPLGRRPPRRGDTAGSAHARACEREARAARAEDLPEPAHHRAAGGAIAALPGAPDATADGAAGWTRRWVGDGCGAPSATTPGPPRLEDTSRRVAPLLDPSSVDAPQPTHPYWTSRRHRGGRGAPPAVPSTVTAES